MDLLRRTVDSRAQEVVVKALEDCKALTQLGNKLLVSFDYILGLFYLHTRPLLCLLCTYSRTMQSHSSGTNSWNAFPKVECILQVHHCILYIQYSQSITAYYTYSTHNASLYTIHNVYTMYTYVYSTWNAFSKVECILKSTMYTVTFI